MNAFGSMSSSDQPQHPRNVEGEQSLREYCCSGPAPSCVDVVESC